MRGGEREEGRGRGVTGEGRREGCSPLLDSDWKWRMCTCSLLMAVYPLRYERRGREWR